MKEKLYLLHITEHGGKLQDVPSLSTSVQDNTRCAARARIPNSICAACYAARLTEYRHNLNAALMRNADVLRARLLSYDECQFNADYIAALSGSGLFRVESFGDTENVTQARNYLRITAAVAERGLSPAIWSKNPDHYRKAMDAENGKPNGVQLVRSSMYINRPALLPAGFDRVFTVYDKAAYSTIEPAPGRALCAGVSCASCRACYTAGGPAEIAERLRGRDPRSPEPGKKDA